MQLKLSQLIKNKAYVITGVENDNPDFIARAQALGFREGVIVTLKGRAPIFSDPLLYELEEGRVALTKTEADSFFAKELN